jgi:hypothetical protein
VLSWSPTVHRKVEAIRDRIFARCGTDEPAHETGVEERALVTRQWRKPLTIEEVARMAQTPAVRERKGRP